ncbi:SAV_915 family protein [Streptomyces sp. NPDC005423]|uniref:SAV_915 family protein n=1 Tax=Streptomyces sp. NPDC005423 TaxID=3155343 RepID=UPI0033A8EC3B
MGEPNRSRLLDYVQGEPAAGPRPPDPGRSRLREYAEAAPAAPAASGDLPGPRPGVPPYHTPVVVPAHPRYVESTDAAGRPVRVPFVVYEIFEPVPGGRAALAFTTVERLVAALGDAQPWVLTSLGPLAEGIAGQGVEVLLDPRVEPGHRNWHPAELAAYAREMR